MLWISPVEFLQLTPVILQLEDFTFSGNVVELPEGTPGPVNLNLFDVTFNSPEFPVNLGNLADTDQLSLSIAAGNITVDGPVY